MHIRRMCTSPLHDQWLQLSDDCPGTERNFAQAAHDDEFQIVVWDHQQLQEDRFSPWWADMM